MPPQSGARRGVGGCSGGRDTTLWADLDPERRRGVPARRQLVDRYRLEHRFDGVDHRSNPSLGRWADVGFSDDLLDDLASMVR
jgi:hypothetical protein